jgi:hypothetical protein
MLTQGGKCYLAPAVLDLLSPKLFDLEACNSDRLLERAEYFLSLLRGEIFLIKFLPSP